MDSSEVFLLYSSKFNSVSLFLWKTFTSLYIPKYNVIRFTALHFINKSCFFVFLPLILKHIKNVVLDF